MRLTGKGVWGPPVDRDEAVRVLRRAVELGVNFIDTADSYGPYVSEEIIREALYPYPDGLVIATKAGLLRTGPDEWSSLGFPDYLRQEAEMSLRRLGVERIDLFQLHRSGKARSATSACPRSPSNSSKPRRRSRPSSRYRTCITSPCAPPRRC